RGRWTFGPTGSLTYSHLWIDGFSENGSPMAQRFSSQEAESLQMGVGGRVSYLFPGNFVSIRPELRAEYRREFMDSARSINSTLIGGGPALQLETSPPSKDFAVIGGGLNAVFSDSTTAFVNYEAEVGRSSYVAHGVYGGVRWNFPGGPMRAPVILFEDEPKDWRDAFWETPVGQAARWIQLRGILHAQYDHLETNSKAGVIDPRDPEMENVLFIRRLRLYAERDLGGGFYVEGAGEYDEHAQGRPPLKLFNANAGWRPIDEFHLMFGFDKVPFSHEENISSARIKTVERSVASRTFTKLGDLGEQHVRLAVAGRFRDVLDGAVGILDRYDLHYEAAIAHPSEDASALWDADPSGTRSSMPAPSYYFRLAHEFRTAWGDLDVGADFAYAPSFRARGSNQPTGAQAVSPFFNYNKGWFNLMGQWMGLTYVRDDANGNVRRSPTGFTIQPSFFVHPKWEIVTMYSTFDTNGDEAIRFNQSVRNAPTFYPEDRRFDNIHQFYLGFNHYIKGNDIKLSTGIERIEADGARANRPVSAEDAWVVRARLQLLF
ncbi:MAG: porin, partial [Verrucomicrobiia bacterium]